jgi:hypothetical protein
MGKGKLLGFFHFPFAICHSGCVFQHPAKGGSHKRSISPQEINVPEDI